MSSDKVQHAIILCLAVFLVAMSVWSLWGDRRRRSEGFTGTTDGADVDISKLHISTTYPGTFYSSDGYDTARVMEDDATNQCVVITRIDDGKKHVYTYTSSEKNGKGAEVERVYTTPSGGTARLDTQSKPLVMMISASRTSTPVKYVDGVVPIITPKKQDTSFMPDYDNNPIDMDHSTAQSQGGWPGHDGAGTKPIDFRPGQDGSGTKPLEPVYPVIFYGPGTCTAQIITISGSCTVVVKLSNDRTIVFYETTYSPQAARRVFHGRNGGTATVYLAGNGKYAIDVSTSKGHLYVYGTERTPPRASSVHVSTPPYSSTKYASVTTAFLPSSFTSSGSDASTSTIVAPGMFPGNYDSAIPASLIPPGQEDLYVLKTQIVPPVWPANQSGFMGDAFSSSSSKKCPPCPACARCPKPDTVCKAVPNYEAYSSDTFPVPSSEYLTYGM